MSRRAGARASVVPVQVAGDAALLQVRDGPLRELRDSPLLRFRRGRLRRATDFGTLSDVAVDSDGRRIAFAHARGGRRLITVKERD